MMDQVVYYNQTNETDFTSLNLWIAIAKDLGCGFSKRSTI